jgi:hypothetical protein
VKKNADLLEEIDLHLTNIGRAVGAELGDFPLKSEAAGS